MKFEGFYGMVELWGGAVPVEFGQRILNLARVAETPLTNLARNLI